MVDEHQQLIAREPREFWEKQQIKVHTRHRVAEIDTKARRLRVEDLEGGEERWEAFDQLLIATGSHPLDPPVPGRRAEGIHGIKTLDGAIRLRRELDSRTPKRAVIVGAGYIGLEMAESLLGRGLEVAIVDQAPRVMPSLDDELAQPIAEALMREGAQLYLSESLAGYESQDGRVTGVITSARSLPADVVVLGMGVRPNSELAAEAGLALGVKNAIRTDKRMATSEEGIWAAGDCAQSHHLVDGRPYYFPLGTVANRHGRIAGVNIAGGKARYEGTAGTSVTRTCGMEIGQTGLREEELSAEDIITEKITSSTRSHYFPGAETIIVKLIAAKADGRLLGGQIVGGPGAGKRIDVVATALQAGLTAAQVSELDLAYAPPFSPLWDPVTIAARQLAKRL